MYNLNRREARETGEKILALETENAKFRKILGDLGLCLRCADGSTMPCTQCGAGL